MDPSYILQLAQKAGLSVHIATESQPQAHISGSPEALVTFVDMIVTQDRELRPLAENLKCKSTSFGYPMGLRTGS